MKARLCLIAIGLLALFGTAGCEIEERHEHRGGYYGRPEYEHGEYRGYPHRHRDWDDRDDDDYRHGY